LNKTGVVNITAKVNGIVKEIHEGLIEEFYFKNAVPDGYKLKLVKGSSIVANVYVTEEEAEELLAKLHIRTDSKLFQVFKLDYKKETKVHEVIYYIHELGIIKDRFSKVNATKEDLINNLVHLGRITKDSEIASLDFEGIQQEEIFNILHNKHLEYLAKYEDFLLTEINSGSYISSWRSTFFNAT